MSDPTSSDLPPSSIPLYKSISDLRTLRRNATLSHETVALIPTMGALHSGHLSLLRAAASTHKNIIISIFVNPAQFSPTEDLAIYPRTLPSDILALEHLNHELNTLSPPVPGRVCGIFLPDVPTLYPAGIPLDTSLQKGAFVSVVPISSKLEGITRPHFFRGVATVVAKLLNIVQPDAAYFGQKDVQQTVVVRTMVRDLCFPTEIVVVPTTRDSGDGLALSSRNVYLGEERRGDAGCLYKALCAAREVYEAGKSAGGEGAKSGEMVHAAREVLEEYVKKGTVEVEYLSLAEGGELEEYLPVDVVGEGAVVSLAVRMLPVKEGQGVVRLIDNIIL
ncbi:hypothetical protein DFH27DRAFT_357798 [Peziza echinospora]|nr:hypothetical protein DFH27DRAFT_357798 [Peziza echinospora]